MVYVSWPFEFLRVCRRIPEHAFETLLSRGVSEEQVVSHQLGWYDGEHIEEAPQAFLDWKGNRDLKDTLVFPLTTVQGVYGGLQFRNVDRAKKGYDDFFWITDEFVTLGLHLVAPSIWEAQKVLYVEGGFDYFPTQRHIPYTLSCLTARANADVLRWTQRLGVDEVIIGFDNDDTGNRGRKAVHDHFKDSPVRTSDLVWPKLPLGEGKFSKDPGDLWELRGDAKFVRFLRDRHLIT